MTRGNGAIPPKLFISYSWTTPDHEAWVIRFATELRESGIDVILNKWDLKEGHDGHAFMEMMVNDPEIKKVALICDKEYAAKADNRSGGVGTETQIITPEIYNKQDQDKFVAIVTERDDHGNAYVPAFYGSRIYIDFTDPSVYAENFEQLIRWVFDEPLHRKPLIGNKPALLTEDSRGILLATSTAFNRAIYALRNNHDHAMALVTEYFELLTAEFEKLRINQNDKDEFDDLVIQSIESFLPYRNEVINIFQLLANSKHLDEAPQVIHRFLEGLLPYMERPKNAGRWKDWDFDNFQFIIHELFLYAVACFTRYEKFEAAAFIMSNDFYLSDSYEFSDMAMVPFHVFGRHLKSLESRNQRLKLSRLSLHADLLEQRSKESAIEFRFLMQTDLLLFLRAHLHHPDSYFYWWPETLLYARRLPKPFEIFARAQSTSYFNKMKCLLGIANKADLDTLIEELYQNSQQNLPRWQYQTIQLKHLLGYDNISTRP